MRCHEILGIRENASVAEINNAYITKRDKLASNQDVLGMVPYGVKCKELDSAKRECLDWSQKSITGRIKERLENASPYSSNDLRINQFCCGPCTCTDICCGEMSNACGCDCLCGEVEVSCCHSVCGSQAIPIIADIAIFAFWGWDLYKKWKAKQEQEDREYRIRQAERAREDNVRLQEQLARCQADQKNIQNNVRNEEQLAQVINAHVSFFNLIGVVGTEAITSNQKSRLQAKKDEMERSRRKERELQEKIASNQRTIDAGH